MRNQLLILSLLLLTKVVYAQVDIAYIRKVYNQTKENLINAEEVTKVSYERTIPALGPTHTTLNFFGHEVLNEDESSHPWSNDGIKKLRFVTVKYNVAESLVESEYLYDPQTQRLLFYYKMDSYSYKEYRYYFNGDTLLKLIISTLSDDPAAETNTEITSNFHQEALDQAQQIIKKADTYQQQFVDLHQLEKIEKR
ncbi:MAG: hypothetical protein ABJH04_07100 [Cyclobacteriaceae bacterium]